MEENNEELDFESMLKPLKDSNNKFIAALVELDYGIDPNHLLKLRVDLLTDILIDAQIINEQMLEFRWEMMLSEMLGNMVEEVTEMAEKIAAQQNKESSEVNDE